MTRPVDILIDRADAILSGEAETLEDWRDALELYTQAATMGSGMAFSRIGDFYYYGDHVKRSKEKALLNYKKAAEIGDPDGYYGLALIYANDADYRNLCKILKIYDNNVINSDRNLTTSDISRFVGIYLLAVRDFEVIESLNDRAVIFRFLILGIIACARMLQLYSAGNLIIESGLSNSLMLLNFAKKFGHIDEKHEQRIRALEKEISLYEVRLRGSVKR